MDTAEKRARALRMAGVWGRAYVEAAEDLAGPEWIEVWLMSLGVYVASVIVGSQDPEERPRAAKDVMRAIESMANEALEQVEMEVPGDGEESGAAAGRD